MGYVGYKKLKEKLKNLNLWMKAVRNRVSLQEWWPIFRVKLLGHYRYYGVSGNARELWSYHKKATELAFKWVNRRSQKRSYTWPGFQGFLKWNPLPQPKIYHNLHAYS